MKIRSYTKKTFDSQSNLRTIFYAICREPITNRWKNRTKENFNYFKNHNQFWPRKLPYSSDGNIDPTKNFKIIDAKNAGKNAFDGYPFSVNKKLQIPGIWCALQDAEQK